MILQVGASLTYGAVASLDTRLKQWSCLVVFLDFKAYVILVQDFLLADLEFLFHTLGMGLFPPYEPLLPSFPFYDLVVCEPSSVRLVMFMQGVR